MPNDEESERRFYQHVSDLAEQNASQARGARQAGIDWALWKPKIRKTALLLSAAMAILLLGAYLYDSVAIRLASQNRRFGSVDVDWFYSVQEKGGKFEFIYDHTQPQSCTNSIFPHFGVPPCWYARRHNQRRIEM